MLSACGGGSSDTTTLPANAADTSNVSNATEVSTTATAIPDPASTATASVPDTTVKTIDAPVVAPVTTPVAEAPPVDSTANVLSVAVASTPIATPVVPKAAVALRSGAGLNLSAFNYFSSSIPTFDVMKRASTWMTQCSGTASCANFAVGAGSWDTLEEASLDLDADGYPRTLPAATSTAVKFRKVTTMVSSQGALPAGRYVVLYDGTGTITYGGAATKSASASKAGRDVVDLTANATDSFWLTITATTPGNYLRNIRIYMPGGACAGDMQTYVASATACTAAKGAFTPFESFPAGSVWNPQYLADLKGFRTLRFMDWGGINNTLVEDWSKRPLPSNRVWSTNDGAPVEAMLSLANAVSADAWMNIPPHANDAYVTQFAKLATQTLSPTLKVNLEYANEPWNYAFNATKWMLAQAQAAWPEEVAKGTSVYALETNWYARRLVQVCSLAKNSMAGASTKFRCISNTQAAQPAQTDQVLACAIAAKTLGQPCAKYIDAAAIAPYFGYYLGTASLRSTIASWYGTPDGGLTNLFQELTGRNTSGIAAIAPLAAINAQAPNGGIAQAMSWMTGTKAVTAKYGVPMWAYEGGQHLVALAGDSDPKFASLILAANRDPRMQAAYEQMIANWQAAGGQTFTYFNHVGIPSKSGSWGMKESMTDNGNAKWKASVEMRDGACWWSGC